MRVMSKCGHYDDISSSCRLASDASSRQRVSRARRVRARGERYAKVGTRTLFAIRSTVRIKAVLPAVMCELWVTGTPHDPEKKRPVTRFTLSKPVIPIGVNEQEDRKKHDYLFPPAEAPKERRWVIPIGVNDHESISFYHRMNVL